MVFYCGHHFAVYTNVKSLYFIPEISMKYVNYTLKKQQFVMLTDSESNLDKAQWGLVVSFSLCLGLQLG